MEGYKAIIAGSSEGLTPIELIKLKDRTNAISLDEVVQPDQPLNIKPKGWVVLSIHNEKSDNKDYNNYLIIDEEGTTYVTGSESFWSSFNGIIDDLQQYGIEDYTLSICKRKSKNYSGKHFLTCTLA